VWQPSIGGWEKDPLEERQSLDNVDDDDATNIRESVVEAPKRSLVLRRLRDSEIRRNKSMRFRTRRIRPALQNIDFAGIQNLDKFGAGGTLCCDTYVEGSPSG
jgi:hypothetical protein